MYNPNNVTQKYPFFELLVEMFQLNKPINQKKQSQKLLSKRLKKRYYKTLGSSVINSPMSPSSMVCHYFPKNITVKLLESLGIGMFRISKNPTQSKLNNYYYTPIDLNV